MDIISTSTLNSMIVLVLGTHYYDYNLYPCLTFSSRVAMETSVTTESKDVMTSEDSGQLDQNFTDRLASQFAESLHVGPGSQAQQLEAEIEQMLAKITDYIEVVETVSIVLHSVIQNKLFLYVKGCHMSYM